MVALIYLYAANLVEAAVKFSEGLYDVIWSVSISNWGLPFKDLFLNYISNL